MNLIQGVSNFFNGIFGKKKKEEQQPQPQSQSISQAAQKPVTFNQPHLKPLWQQSNTLGLSKSPLALDTKSNNTPLIQAPASKPLDTTLKGDKGMEVIRQQLLGQSNGVKPTQDQMQRMPKVLSDEGKRSWLAADNMANRPKLNEVKQPAQQNKPQLQPQTQRPSFKANTQGVKQAGAVIGETPNLPKQKPARIGMNPYSNSGYSGYEDRALNVFRETEKNLKLKNAAKQDVLDAKMRARGASEEEITQSRKERDRLYEEGRSISRRAAADKALEENVGKVTGPLRTVGSALRTAEDFTADTVNELNKWIDSSDKEAGFQWNSLEDYARFLAKLPGGMVEGLVSAPRKIGDAISGGSIDREGNLEQLDGWRRLGKAIDGGVSLGGIGVGASRTLLKSILGKSMPTFAAGAASNVSKAAKAAIAAKEIAKDAAKESVEEVIQTFGQDLADDGKVNTDVKDYLLAAYLGGIGGGAMSGAGRGIGTLRNVYSEGKTSDGVNVSRLHPNQMKYNVAEVLGSVTGDARKRLSKLAFEDLQAARVNNPYRTGEGMDVELSRNGNRKMTAISQKTPNEMFTVQQRLAPKIGEALEKSRQIDRAVDTKNHGFARDGFSYNEVPVRYKGQDYVTTFDIGSNNDRNLVYNATTRKSSTEPAGINPSTELHRLEDFHSDTILNSSGDVNDTGHSHKVITSSNPVDGFNNSGNQELVVRVGDVEIVLGDYGRNATARKIDSPDRFDASELPETLNNVKDVYRSGDSSFRKDNIALVSEMPNGEKRVVYTRLNKSGQEEIINWHKITAPKYEDGLKSYGTPAWNRTRDFGLEHLAEDPLHRSVESKGDLATSESLLHDADSIAKTDEVVNRADSYKPTKPGFFGTSPEDYHYKIKQMTNGKYGIFEEYANGNSPQLYSSHSNPTIARREAQRLAAGLEKPIQVEEVGKTYNGFTERSAEIELRKLQATRPEYDWEIKPAHSIDHHDIEHDRYGVVGVLREDNVQSHNTESTARQETSEEVRHDVESPNRRENLDAEHTSTEQDQIRQFYAQAETGKFKSVSEADSSAGAQVAYRTDSERALNTLKDFDDVLNGRKPKVEIARITPELADRIYQATGIEVTPNSGVDLDQAGAVHTVSTRGQGGKKTALQLTDSDLAALPDTIEQADVIRRGYAKRGTERVVFEKDIGRNRKAVTEVIKKGNTLRVVTYFNDTSSGRTDAAHNVSSSNDTFETGQLQSTYLDDTVSDKTQDVNTTRFKLEKTKQQAVTLEAAEKNLDAADKLEKQGLGDIAARVRRQAEADIAKVNHEIEARKKAESTEAEHIDLSDYIDEMVSHQKRSSKLDPRELLFAAKQRVKHYMIDDAVAYEDYMKVNKDGLSKTEFKEAKAELERKKTELRENIDRVRNSNMIAQQFIRESNLIELGKLSTQEIDEFQQYLIAKRHVEDLAPRGIETGRNLARDKGLLKQIGDKYAKQEAAFREFNTKLLDYMVDNDLISAENKVNLIENNPNYAPFKRLMEETEAFTGNTKQLANLSHEGVIQKIKGSKRAVLNPIESVMENTMRVVNEAERNQAAQSVAKGVFKENKLDKGAEPRPGYDTISFLEKGKQVRYEVPKLVAQELKKLNSVLPEPVEFAIKVLGAPTRMLRAGATGINPTFAGANFVRDQVQTLITSDFKTWGKGLKPAFVATFSPTAKGKALRAELRRNGIIGSEYRQTYGYKHGDLVKELQKEYGLKHPVVKSVDKMRHPIDTIADIIGTTEYFTRAQQYFGTKGDTVAKAQAARNNTLNFSRAGSITRVLNRIIPYLNAGVQGSRISTKTFIKRPARTAVAVSALAGVLLAAKAINEASEEKKEIWDKITDSDKKTNLVFLGNDAKINPETGRVEGVLKIPMPQMLYPLIDGVNNTKGEPEDLIRIAGNIFTAFGGGIDAENPVNQLTPTAVKPIMEESLNRNSFTKRELVSENDKNKAPEDKGAKYSSGFARRVAEITGVDAPIVDNYIQNYTGSLGRDIARSFTDNPDNTKDAGGWGDLLLGGYGRRFASASAKSEYMIAEEQAKQAKKQLRDSPEFKRLPQEDKVKVLDRIDADYRGIAGQKTKAAKGEQADVLSDRQGDLVKNGVGSNYLEDALMTKEQRAEKKRQRLLDVSSAEYEDFKVEYDRKKQRGGYTKIQRLEDEHRLKKLEVGKDTPKDIRDTYDASKSLVWEMLNAIEDEGERNKMKWALLDYGDALVKAGVTDKNKFRDKYGGVKFDPTTKSNGRGRGGSRRGGAPQTLQASNISKNSNALALSMNSFRRNGTSGAILPKFRAQNVNLMKMYGSRKPKKQRVTYR